MSKFGGIPVEAEAGSTQSQSRFGGIPVNDPAQQTRPRNPFQGMGLKDIQAAYQKARKAGADDQTLASIADAYVAREQQEGGFGLALDDTIRGLARGTLGIGEGLDETSAYLNTLGGLTGDYQENLDYQRARDRYLDNSAPVLSTGLKVAGGVASAIAAAPRLGIGTAQTLGQNVLRSGIAGTAGGATTGFLAGEGGAGNRGAKAAVGGVVGGTLGVAVPVAAAGLSGTGRLIQSRLAPGTVNAEQRAGEVLGQAMTRSDMRPGNVSSFGDMQAKGINNATLADLSDELTSLTGAVARSPGRGRQIVGDFLRARQEGDPLLGQAGGGQWADLFDDISRLVSPSVSAKRAGQAMITRRAEEAKPLYDRAFEVGDIVSDRLRTLGGIPAMKTALQRGLNMAKQEGRLPPEFKLDLSKPLPVEVWHQAKQGIDDMIGAAVRTGEKGQARSLLTMQKTLLDELDNATGGLYGEARNNFAGNSAVLNALEQGKSVLSKEMGPEDIADYLARLTSESEKQAFRAGVAQTMRDTVGRVGRTGNAAAKFINRPDIQQKLQAIFDDPQDYQAFMARMVGRSRQYRTYSELQNSATAQRQIAAQDLDASIQGGVPAENIIASAVTGGRAGVVRNLMQRLQDGPVSLLNERTKAKLAEMLTTNDPQQIQRVMDVVEAAYRRAREGTARNAAVQTGLVQSGVVQPVVSQ
ncbi:MAG: hypothetical protein ACK52K_18395 [Alphaproteobacteria bacterium]|jgi:hypothetical protein